METGTALVQGQSLTSEAMLSRAEAIEDNYRFQIRHFVRWARARGQGFDEDGIRDYFRFLNEESGYTAATIRIKRQAVKARVRQLFHDAPIDDRMKIDRVLSDLDHDTATKAPKINSSAVTRDRVLAPSEYFRLLDSCRSERQRLFIRFLWATGCRVSELTGARLERCEILGQAVKIRILGKGSKERKIEIPVKLFDAIRATFQGSTYLFETSRGHAYCREYVSGQIKTIGRLIGRNISAHSLRHSWATRMVVAYPGHVKGISKYMGHSSTSITMDMYVGDELGEDLLFAGLEPEAVAV